MWHRRRTFSRIAAQIFMNSDIERRKCFDINSDDFTYCDILQHQRERLAMFVDEEIR